MGPASPSVESVVQRIRGEYLEMPGLRLNASQAARLCGLDPGACQCVLTVSWMQGSCAATAMDSVCGKTLLVAAATAGLESQRR